MGALKQSMQAKGRAWVRDAVRKRMGKPPKEEEGQNLRQRRDFLEATISSKALDYNTSRANSVRANKGNRRRDSQHRDRSGADSRTSRNGARHRRQCDPGASRLLPNWGKA